MSGLSKDAFSEARIDARLRHRHAYERRQAWADDRAAAQERWLWSVGRHTYCEAQGYPCREVWQRKQVVASETSLAKRKDYGDKQRRLSGDKQIKTALRRLVNTKVGAGTLTYQRWRWLCQALSDASETGAFWRSDATMAATLGTSRVMSCHHKHYWVDCGVLIMVRAGGRRRGKDGHCRNLSNKYLVDYHRLRELCGIAQVTADPLADLAAVAPSRAEQGRQHRRRVPVVHVRYDTKRGVTVIGGDGRHPERMRYVRQSSRPGGDVEDYPMGDQIRDRVLRIVDGGIEAAPVYDLASLEELCHGENRRSKARSYSIELTKINEDLKLPAEIAETPKNPAEKPKSSSRKPPGVDFHQLATDPNAMASFLTSLGLSAESA